jgi:hypothetical protein
MEPAKKEEEHPKSTWDNKRICKLIGIALVVMAILVLVIVLVTRPIKMSGGKQKLAAWGKWKSKGGCGCMAMQQH